MSANQNKFSKNYVLDTSAIVAFLADENGSDNVANILNSKDAHVLVSFISLMELEYNYLRKGGKLVATELLLKLKFMPWHVSFTNDYSMIHQAAKIKVENSLSVADAWIAALAIANKAILIHKDPEFEPLAKDIELLTLPYS